MNSTQQRGFGLLGWFIVIMFLALISMLAMRVTPIYLQHYSIVQILGSLKDETTLTSSEFSPSTVTETKKILKRRFFMNDIDRDMLKNVKITSSASGFTVNLPYEEQADLFDNVRLLFTFDPSVEVTTKQ